MRNVNSLNCFSIITLCARFILTMRNVNIISFSHSSYLIFGFILTMRNVNLKSLKELKTLYLVLY